MFAVTGKRFFCGDINQLLSKDHLKEIGDKEGNIEIKGNCFFRFKVKDGPGVYTDSTTDYTFKTESGYFGVLPLPLANPSAVSSEALKRAGLILDSRIKVIKANHKNRVIEIKMLDEKGQQLEYVLLDTRKKFTDHS